MATRNHRFPLGEGKPAVEIRNPAGSVGIDAPEGATEFVVDVEPLNNAAEQVLDEVQVDAVGSRLRVLVPERRMFRSPAFAVRVTAPSGSDVRVAVASADAVLRGPLGRVDLTSSSGAAALESCEELQLRTASGEARIGTVTGPATLASASGDLWVDAVGGGLHSRTASGDVAVGDAAGDIWLATASGDVALSRLRGGTTQVRTVSGDVVVGVVPGLRVWLDLSSVSGRMESELTEDDDAPADGPAQLSIAVHSVSGRLRVRPVPLAS